MRRLISPLAMTTGAISALRLAMNLEKTDEKYSTASADSIQATTSKNATASTTDAFVHKVRVLPSNHSSRRQKTQVSVLSPNLQNPQLMQNPHIV